MRQGRIILIRHGRTKWNKLRYIGWEDVPLDRCGQQQAESVSRQLQDEKIDHIYSSPLSRALDTIRPFAETRNLPIRTSDDLKELCYGNMQGLLKAEHKLYVKKSHQHVPIPGGESIFDLYKRAKRFIGDLKSDLDLARNIVIVGHFLTNQMLYMVLCNIPFDTDLNQISYKPGNGSLFELQYMIDDKSKNRTTQADDLPNNRITFSIAKSEDV